MVPGRYAKNEMSSGFIGAIDRYVYQSPLAQAAIQAASNAGTTPANGGTTPSNTDQTTQPTPGAGTTPSKPDTTHPAPMAANQGAVKHANPQ
jgi:heme-binding NEAT domain protein